VQYNHDKTQASEYAASAMERVKIEGLSPTPHVFELWYVYFSGQSPEVTKAIDILIANKQKITDQRCNELYQRFLSEERDEVAIRKAGDQIHSTIQNVSGVVRDVKSATTEYSGKLDGVSHRMEGVKDAGELKSILQNVMADTNQMIAQNQRLEQQLDQSSQIMEELQRNLETVRREALTDGLTGLSNRKAFDSELRRISEEAVSMGQPFTLMMLDIDHFKSFNDNYGHLVGDQVLRLVARTLTDGVKGRDIAARYGGEEFAIILPETNLQAGVVVGNALRKAVATKDVINRATGEKLARITMSVGVAEYAPGEEVNDLIERADAALYTAKHNGRNQVAAAPTPGKKQKKKG
jgi:diguanylate cyclase